MTFLSISNLSPAPRGLVQIIAEEMDQSATGVLIGMLNFYQKKKKRALAVYGRVPCAQAWR